MYCVHCGKKIEEDSRFCMHCGNAVPEELLQQAHAIQPTPHVVSIEKPKKSKKGLFISLIAFVLTAALVASLIIFIPQILPKDTPSIGDSEEDNFSLQEDLMQKWTRTGSMVSNYRTYTVEYTLDITQSTITCNYTLSGEEITITAFRYEVISDDEIQRKNTEITYEVTFNKDKTIMTISPALCSEDDSEIWYLSGNDAAQQEQQNAKPSASEKNSLNQALAKAWTRTDGSDGSYTEHHLTFDISDYWVDYHCEYVQLGGSSGTNFGYEIVAANQIQDIYSGTIYTISFNEAKNVMTISPAISSSEASEQWFYMEG